MVKSEIIDLIKQHGLRVTNQRCVIVDLFTQQNAALSYTNLKKKLPSSFDRVTVYRTLKSFEEKGLIHVIPNANGEPNYALCNHSEDHGHKCSPDHHNSHQDLHAHFQCNSCQNIECLPKQSLVFKIPKGYKQTGSNILVFGLCNSCAAK